MSEKETAEEEAAEVDAKCDICQSAINLQICLKDIVEKILQGVSENKFVDVYKECYNEFNKKGEIEKPALSGSSVEAKKYHSQFNSITRKSAFKAIEQTVANINQNLKELEELKKDQKNGTVIWRPPGDALQHMKPFLYLCELEKKRELENKIKKEQEAVKLLKLRVAEKRAKAAACHCKILSSIKDIENVVTTKIGVDVLNEHPV